MTVGELRCEIEDTLKELYRITDMYVPLSQQGRFSEYDSAKEKLQEMADMFIAQQEEIDEDGRASEKLRKLQEEIMRVSTELEDISSDDWEPGYKQGKKKKR